MSLQNPLKPQTAMKDNASGEYFYPMTVPSQVLMPDGRRLDACLADMGGMELLWTNASPTSEFAPQTVSLNLSAYKFVVIIFKRSTTSSKYISYIAPIGYVHIANFIEGKPESRNYTTSTNGIAFAEAYIWDSSTAMSLNNGTLLPYKIFGIK